MAQKKIQGAFQPIVANWLKPGQPGYDGFGGWLTAEQLRAHYEQNYYGYFDKLNKLATKDSKLAAMTKMDAMLSSYQVNDDVFHNAAQIVNHEIFWNCITPHKSFITAQPAADRQVRQRINEVVPEDLLAEIESSFGSFNNFITEFNSKSEKHFASGWTWLVWASQDNDQNGNQSSEQPGGLLIFDTPDAYCPYVDGYTPILVLDLWEHAYYLDYEAQRKAYINNFWQYVDWMHVGKRFRMALQQQ